MSTRRAGMRKLSSASSTTADGPSNTSHDGPDRRPSSRPISNGRSSGAVPLSSSSISQRLPARSFVTHPSVNSMDPAHYSSYGVREQTAELASFAFTEPGSFKNNTSPRNRSDSLPGNAGLNYGTSNTQDDDHLNPQRWNDPPDVIHEVSEPVSPEGTSLEQSSSMSNITKLLRTQSYRSDCEQDHHQSPRKHSVSGKEERNEREVPEVVVDQVDGTDERTSLLGKSVDVEALHKDYGTGDVEDQLVQTRKPTNAQRLVGELRHKIYNVSHIATHPKSWSRKAIWERGIKEPAGLLPCVFLGLMLNILDALSYGMILFPLGEPVFAKTGPDGISMFYVSCIVSQLVFSCGGSIFKGGVGSEMIEVVPFFHKMTYTIIARVGTSNPKALMATTITAYAMSSIMTGMVFGILGAFRLGSLVNFFPRHILIGCIGGVGFFLFVTGVEVSARIEGNLEYNLATAEKLFRGDTIALWTVPLVLAIVLLTARRFWASPYLVPGFFVSTAAIFYIVVAAVADLNIPLMRQYGWVFNAVESGVPFYNFYSYYDFHEVDWKALAATIPAMLALTFFGILHVPINIPALAIAAKEDDLNLNRELVAHGVSNALSGFLGSIQNYLVYVNSEMFISNGGNNRLAGLMLAAATFGVWIAGPGMIGYVPIMVVGALIFYLGIELLKEALYDSWGKMNRLEYLTVIAIVLVMGIYDFVAGILAGIVLACFSFVLQTSRKSAIRATYSGEVVESTVRRHPIQRHYLHGVGDQIFVIKLSGFLFFGSIVEVEKQSRALIEEEAFRAEPILYLIFDLAHVNGLDYSAAEAFTRIERILGRKNVQMIVSGVDEHSEVGSSLRNVGLWQDSSSVEFFETLNGALESCENSLLKAFYRQRDTLDGADASRRRSIASRGTSEAREIPDQRSLHPSFSSNIANSPRQAYLTETAKTTLNDHDLPLKKWQSFKQPLPLILQTFQALTQKNEDFWFKAVPFFERVEYVAGSVLFMKEERSKAFYLLETGILHAHYSLPVGCYHESIVAGTTCGELPFFSETPRTATVSAERDCVCWRLDEKAWARMQKEWPEGAGEMLKIALKLTKERVDSVTSYVLTTAG